MKTIRILKPKKKKNHSKYRKVRNQNRTIKLSRKKHSKDCIKEIGEKQRNSKVIGKQKQ